LSAVPDLWRRFRSTPALLQAFAVAIAAIAVVAMIAAAADL